MVLGTLILCWFGFAWFGWVCFGLPFAFCLVWFWFCFGFVFGLVGFVFLFGLAWFGLARFDLVLVWFGSV